MIRINFGAGSCRIEGWRNTDICYPDGPDKIDITKELPFETGSVDLVMSEMNIEHTTHQEAWNFLCEAHRILKPNGLIRVVIPDFSLSWRLQDPEWLRVNQGVTNNDGSLRDQFKSILFCHGHKSLWNAELLRDVLSAIGFKGATIWPAGQSNYKELRDIEQHWHSVGKAVALSESGCVEGVR